MTSCIICLHFTVKTTDSRHNKLLVFGAFRTRRLIYQFYNTFGHTAVNRNADKKTNWTSDKRRIFVFRFCVIKNVFFIVLSNDKYYKLQYSLLFARIKYKFSFAVFADWI